MIPLPKDDKEALNVIKQRLHDRLHDRDMAIRYYNNRDGDLYESGYDDGYRTAMNIELEFIKDMLETLEFRGNHEIL
jgi:hypothetical protein